MASESACPTIRRRKPMPEFEAADFYNLEELLTAEERRIRDDVRRWVQERFLPVVAQHYRDGTFPMELVPELAKLNGFGPSIKGAVLVSEALRLD
jgi:glutaryl-CoA dehydrogenase